MKAVFEIHSETAADGRRRWSARDARGERAAFTLVPSIGMPLPRCWYRLGCVVHAAPSLQLFQRQRTLLLGNDLTGAAELAEITFDDDDALAALLQAAIDTCRSATVAIGSPLIVELPGLRDAAGVSPFWQGLGRHFYAGDPAAAEAAHGAAWRSHVAALLPRHPVYTSFLPPAAEAAIGVEHADAKRLRAVLEAQGFRHRGQVRGDDAGPVLECDTGPA